MKIIIVEGLDNTGKTTNINEIVKYFATAGLTRYMVAHCTGPQKGLSNKEAAEFQDNQYSEWIDKLIEYNKNDEYDFIIFDRFFYGEYIYGPMYRGREYSEVLKMINSCETRLIREFDNGKNLSLIFLTGTSEFLHNNDDGLSLSSADNTKIEHEIKMFDTLYNNSILSNKARIVVCENNTEFKPRNIIFGDILKVID